MAEETKKIKIIPGGPYEVTADIPLNHATIVPDARGAGLKWDVGTPYETPGDEPYHLCRCGHSRIKPFCDGTHEDVMFHDEEVARDASYDENAKCYEGDTVDLLDDEDLCAVARFCDRGEQVWTYAVASSQPGFEKEAIYQACACPGGRLTIRRKTGEKIEPALPQEISTIEDPAKEHRGPLWVKGGIQVEGADGRLYHVRNRVTLCRCGQSDNMPFCDATHLQCDHMKGLDGES